MSEISIRSDFDVELVESAGSDALIGKAARVSTVGFNTPEVPLQSANLIRYLLSNRHGSPFEHAMLMFRISAPIVVWREFMRHRVGVSYNEQSGRYMELAPVFYIPDTARNLVQEGKPGHYTLVPGAEEQYFLMDRSLYASYQLAWNSYQDMLKAGIAKEVARFCLPVATYSSAYVTMNPRSLMHFLSLRTLHKDSRFPSFPQWEINQVANQMEDIFRGLFPLTHKAFEDAGRVAP